MKNKNAFTPIVAVGFLISLTVISFAFLFTWQSSFQSDWDTKIRLSGDAGPLELLELARINSTHATVGVKNKGGAYHIISEIKVDNRSCGPERSNVVEYSEKLYINCSIQNNQVYDVYLYGDKGVYTKTLTSYASPLSFTNEGFIFTYSATCNFAEGYKRIYGLDALTNSHIEESSSNLYTYSACVWHSNYTLGTNDIGYHITYGYVPALNNSNFFSSTESSILPVSEWFDLSISSSGGVFSLNITDDVGFDSTNYTCIGKVDLDDVYGTHFGDCFSSYNYTIWVNLE